jgi:hypothetical protein
LWYRDEQIFFFSFLRPQAICSFITTLYITANGFDSGAVGGYSLDIQNK